jgi:hypothetical protein
MARAIALRPGFSAAELRRLARRGRDAAQDRRLPALASIRDGGTRSEAAQQRRGTGRADRPQGARPRAAADRRTTPGAGRADRLRPGPGGPWRGALAAVRGVRRLAPDADREPGTPCEGLPHALGPAEASRPGRGRHRGVQEDFPPRRQASHASRTSASTRWRRGQAGPEERHHPALGTARHPPRGAAGPAHRADRILGAVCPQEGKGAALVLPARGTAAMSPHLGGISAMAGPGQHAVPLLGQAGWPPPATSPCRTADRANGHIGPDWREWV